MKGGATIYNVEIRFEAWDDVSENGVIFGNLSNELSKTSSQAEISCGRTDYNAVRTKTDGRAVSTRPTEAATQPTMDTCAWIHQCPWQIFRMFRAHLSKLCFDSELLGMRACNEELQVGCTRGKLCHGLFKQCQMELENLQQ